MKGRIKQEKAITLVALIITIIVLLILAVVAINSITNTDLITKTNTAATKYNQSVTNEQGIMEGYGDYLKNYINGNEEDEPIDEELAEIELMRKYVMGPTGNGREASQIADMSTYEVTSFKDDPESINNASTTITKVRQAADETKTKEIVYAKYNDRLYKIVLDRATLFTESVELITMGREGQTVKYDSNGDETPEDWIVLTDRNGLVEIVSKDVIKDADGNILKLTLGGNDPEIKGNLLKYLDLDEDGVPDDLDGDKVIEEGGTDLDKDNTIETDPEDIAIASYNNAITTINNYCKSLVKEELRNKVRSVGAASDISGDYSSTNFNSWFKKSETVKVKIGDKYYKTDFERMTELGIVVTGADYWLASRGVVEYSSFANFRVRIVRSNGDLNYIVLWDVRSDGDVDDNYRPSYAVRLVITNPEI